MIGACDDLRLGGTLATTGISGGVSINSTALAVRDWSGIFGTPGLSGVPLEMSGRTGAVIAGDLLGKPRFLTLNMAILPLGPDQTLLSPSACEQLWDNTDDFLTLLADPAGAYLEVDLPDTTTRFLHVTNLDPAPIDAVNTRREISVPLVADWPWWRAGSDQSTDTITTNQTLTTGGRVAIYNATLVFSGDGTFTHNDLGWEIEVTGSAGAVTINLGRRTVTEGGNPALNLVRRNSRDWGWFAAGANDVTSDVSVEVRWRDQWS